MRSEETKTDYRTLALNRIAVREYASNELRTYLIRKGAATHEAEEIVRELVDDQRIDDRRYARVIARHQAFRDKGPAYILAKLRQKGVRLSLQEVQALYEETLPETYDSELAMAQRVIERRYPHAMSDRKEKHKAFNALLRRGFSRQVIQKCLFRATNDDMGGEVGSWLDV